MNKRKKTILGCALGIMLFVRGGTADGQNIANVPAPPYVAPVPEFFQWTMTLDERIDPGLLTTFPGTKLPKGLKINKIVCNKTKDTRRDVINYDNGLSVEVWHYQKYLLMKSATGDITVGIAGGRGSDLFDPELSKNGFAYVDWLSSENFQEKRKGQTGQGVFIFKGAVGSTGHGGQALHLAAMIAADSRLPLVVEKDNGRITTTISFSYQPAPTQILELPADLQQQLASVKGRMDFMEQLHAIH